MNKFKRVLIILGKSFLVFIGLIGIYLLTAFCCSRITVDREEGQAEEIDIYILTNGVHTDIVMPAKNDIIDWTSQFSLENIKAKDRDYGFVSLGWGDKGFYLQTPTWADLKASVAFKAAFGLSSSAIHATYYQTMNESESCRRMKISAEQYQRLIRFIKESLDQVDGNSIYIPTDANYGDSDAFYEATGSYSLFHTCNTWANNALKSCGQKSCLWTIFDTGIFEKYKE